MAIPIILNPAANSTRAAFQMERMRHLEPEPELHVTNGIGNARELCRMLTSQGHKLIAIAGGDGTVNEAINGLASHNLTMTDHAKHAALGILPVGTMNVFAYELGLPSRDLQACWQIIQAGRCSEIDLWQANEQYFVQLAGVGLDAMVVQQTSWELKKRLGPLSYALSAARVLAQAAPMLTVELEDRPPLYGPLVLIGNGRHYGGPVPVFREASNTDGLLDVVVFHNQRTVEALQFLRAVANDGYQECDDIDYVQAAKFKVSAAGVPYELDGELGGVAPVTFQAAPFRLRVAAP
ncbi:MAG: diacylglycerol/lipid kinase family protein [Roseimicrobium sp.]